MIIYNIIYIERESILEVMHLIVYYTVLLILFLLILFLLILFYDHFVVNLVCGCVQLRLYICNSYYCQ